MAEYNPFSLIGKTILVTGASSGIGRGIAVACSKMGAQVIVTGRNDKRLEETLMMMTTGEHNKIVCDLTIGGEVTTMVNKLPLLDGIVHCAGVSQRIPCKLLKKDDVDSLMRVNFSSPVILQSELMRQKKIRKDGSIVFIASAAADMPSVSNAVYSASKGALISYAKCLALEVASRKVRVNCISPAMVKTDMILRDGIDELQLEEDESKYPLKRYGTPEDIANLAIYMLSDASSWMTGNNVHITGGVS